MWRWIQRQRQRSTPEPDDTDQRALVFYALPHEQDDPGTQSPSIVFPFFDPVDAQHCFAPPRAPRLHREPAQDLRLRLQQIDTNALRDPNSRGRVQYLRGWLDEHPTAHTIAWTLEETESAGDGVSWMG